jgi:D-lactate dehydrogenase
MNRGKPVVAVYDTKPYDRDYLSRAVGADEPDWHFHDFRLELGTALAAKGAQAICVFVNDILNANTAGST